MSQALAERQDMPVQTLRLVAVPVPGDVSTYQRLNDLHVTARALVAHIDAYRHTPALPANEGYRRTRMERIEAAIADLREVLGNG